VRTRNGRNVCAAALVAAVLVALVAQTACGSDDPPATVEVPEVVERPDDAQPQGATVEVGSDPMYFAGFEVEVVEATFEPAEAIVGVDLAVTNLSEDSDVVFPAQGLMLTWGEEMVTGFLGEVGEVFAGTTRNLTVEFLVDDTFGFGDAVLAGGRPGDIRPTVELFPPFAVEPFAPIELVVPDPATDGDLTVAVTGMRLQGYEPAGSVGLAPTQQADGTPILVVDMTLTSAGAGPSGANFSPSSFRLKLPDGTTRGAVAGDIAVLDPGVSIDVSAVFELVDVALDPEVLGEGTYELVVTDDRGLDSEVVMAFTLEADSNTRPNGS